MLLYILKRLGMMIITLFLILTITFLLLQIVPGSPFNNPKMTPAQLEKVEELYGLNDPVPVQYFRYMKGVVTKLDFGISFKFRNRPVTGLIFEKIEHTVQIGGIAMLFGVPIGILLGAIAAIYKNGFWDNVTTVLAVLGVSIPMFVLAALMQYYLSFRWDLFPFLYVTTDVGRGVTSAKHIFSMILPASALSIFVIASSMRYMRSELVEVLNSDHIMLARAKGLKRSKVILRHALRNALIPVITVIGPMTVMLISGSTVVERFFGVPGLAQMLISAIGTRDYFLILGIAFAYSFILVSVILIVDLLYGVIDPRIRLAGGNS